MGEVPPPVLFPENIRTGKPYPECLPEYQCTDIIRQEGYGTRIRPVPDT